MFAFGRVDSAENRRQLRIRKDRPEVDSRDCGGFFGARPVPIEAMALPVKELRYSMFQR